METAPAVAVIVEASSAMTLTRWAVIPLVIFFVVAGFIQHADDPWSRKELAFLFLVAFLPLLFTGPGRYSLDALIAKKKSGPAASPPA